MLINCHSFFYILQICTQKSIICIVGVYTACEQGPILPVSFLHSESVMMGFKFSSV